MKKILFTAVFSAVVLLSGAAREGAGNEQFSAQTDRLSVRLLLNEWRAGFARKDFQPGLDRMKKEMIRNPQHNLASADAKRNAEKWFRDELRSRYSAEVETILRPFASSLSAEEIERFRAGENAFFEQRFRELFESGFSKVRKELVDEQRKMVFRKIYPTPEELESMTDFQLSKVLMERLHKGLDVPLWEENIPLVQSTVVLPAIRSGRTQQKLQLTLVQRETVPSSLWEARAVEAYLARELESSLARQIPDPAERYGFFPATKKHLKIKAKGLPAARLIAAFPGQLPADRYVPMLEKDPAGHKRAQDSFRLAAPEFQKYLLESAVQQSGVPESFLAGLRNDPEVIRAAGQRYRELTPQLQTVRNEFAAAQLKKSWPVLEAGKWVPEMTETEAYAGSGSKVIPALKGRPESAAWLYETEEKADHLIRSAFAREVRRLEVQEKSVPEVYAEVFSAMEKLQASRKQEKSWFESMFSSGDITQDEVRKMYRESVISRSSEPLFPLVEKDIEMRSGMILQRILTPVSGKNEDIELYLSGNERELTLSFGSWKYPFRTGKFSASGIEKEIRMRMAQTKAPGFRIRLFVNGDRICYKDAVQIREALETAFPECVFKDSLQK